MIEKKDVEYIAKLARLKLPEEELEFMSKELSAIVGYIDQLNEVDTEGVEPTVLMTADSDRLRDDEIKKSIPRDELLKNGPSVKKGFFAIPKVIG